MNEIQMLKNKISRLEQDVEKLKRAGTVPVEIEQALEKRDFLTVNDIGNAPAGAEVAGMGFKSEIELTGNAQTITVLAEPTKYLRVKNKNYGGVAIYIPVYYL